MITVMELDCGEMPPDCGFQCGVCVQEIKDAVESLAGVLRFSQHLDNRIEIEHDPEQTSRQELLEKVAALPAGQKGTFVPKTIEA